MPFALHFFDDCALTFSVGHRSGLHAHRALQATVGLDGSFDVRDDADATASVEFAAFAPLEAHDIRAGDTKLAYLFFDPGAHAWRRWSTSEAPRPPSDVLLGRLERFAADPIDRDVAHELATDWRRWTWPGLRRDVPPDPRIARAVTLIDASDDMQLNYRSLAEQLHLSPSRFAALFREGMGMPVRNYLLWRRLLRAVEALQTGASVTTVAHETGFADAAHLSRSFRRIIGSSPSDLPAEDGRSVI